MPVFNSTLAKRRRFQPPITTYFTSAAESDASGTHEHYSATTFSPTPVVPAKVQASLLSVGMRVRKSSDDGDAFSLPPSSQESNASAPLPRLNGQKRQFDLDNDVFADDEILADADDDSWREKPLERTILTPSLGQQRRRVSTVPQKHVLASTNLILDDFEEASFLRRREEVDSDYKMDCA
ncbi:hypothetical protein N7468_007637 [Penicillium chermesinum]|uniref:Uncharacterized protein n=1 Tax=Penicillium chermesinum TaxID=63820 RepID=A0A9W9TKN8_9EURO|nr:uncharacterized protein N7468_007637 [Penicillium chermesinum]KAJ5226412.1 hypothetical protein N7468_007637 [Penicillium chermesinum]